MPGELDKLSIGVDLTRDPASIAREIERRLLPGYEPIFHALAERVAKDRAYEENRDRLYRLIEPLASRDVRVEAGTDVEVKVVAHLTEEKARAVFALLAERWPELEAD